MLGEQGIICNKCVGGKTEKLWTLDYKNTGDYKKVWDFIDRFEKDTDLKFSGDRSFWEDFLVGLCKCGLMQRIALKFGKYKNL